MEKIQFICDIPFSEVNTDLYKNIYVIEQWLRRITYTTLLLCHGENWLNQIPVDILSALKQRRGNLKGRIILDCENNSNIVWLSTLDELHRLLTMDSHWNIVTQLTGYVKNDFTEWINILREIRNIIGHNRATTFQTLNICNGIQTYLNKGINRFKKNVFLKGYNERSQEFEGELYPIANERIPNSLIIFTKTDLFCEISSLPVDRNFSFIDIPAMIDHVKPLESVVLAIEVNITGNEYGILWTKNLSSNHEDEIISRFIDAELNIWRKDDYISQSAKHLCDPKIWFYDDNIFFKNDDITNIDADKIGEPDNVIQFPQH